MNRTSEIAMRHSGHVRNTFTKLVHALHEQRYFQTSTIAVCLLAMMALVCPDNACALGGKKIVGFSPARGAFPLSKSGKCVPLCVSSEDFAGVRTIVGKWQADLGAVTGARPEIILDSIPAATEIVVVGTLGKDPLLATLVSQGKLAVESVQGKWESFVIQCVENPFRGVHRALVIAGSDKRGTIYGMLEISQQMGVSPWYWWADVPVKHHKDLFVESGPFSSGPPSVKYRGIFLNDEAPDLSNWIYAKYGTIPPSQTPPIPPGIANYGHEFYARLFELILRLKGNYLWPAMWNNAFNEDDSENARLADEYGIVMGTSHQEPMLRAQKEWDRRYLHSLGTWNYAKYPDTLRSFWREGVRRNKNYESIVTIGLRGANDTPMAPGGPEANRALLEEIVGVQRKILAEEVNPDVTHVPQLWCLYKEVLDFYNSGMRVPDDVTLLWPDDNWGNNRRLPTAEERARSGGAGIYYHFDYHGGPRSYQWINTDPIPKIWEQMSQAKEYGADRIWIVNVGHFKGYEFPLEYFMDLAWNTSRWTNENLDEYTRQWAAREFDPKYAASISDIVAKYTRYNGRRKPELLSPSTYSLVHYREAERVVAEFKAISDEAESIYRSLPEEQRNAFYELVLFPTKAGAIVNELYLAAGQNALYARQGRSSANDAAAKTRALFTEDTSLMGYFNRTFAGGKWNHFMDQSHLGYTNWADPPENSLRAITLKELKLPQQASMGVAIEGSEQAWPDSSTTAILPEFDVFNDQKYFVEIFNRGTEAFSFSVRSSYPWIHISSTRGTVRKQSRLWVRVDWNAVPPEVTRGTLTISGANNTVTVYVDASKPMGVTPTSLQGFVESGRVVSMEAAHFAVNDAAGSYRWIGIDGYGHTLSAMKSIAPLDAPPAIPGTNAPCLQYRMYLFTTGEVDVEGVFGPVLNFTPARGVRYGVSFDDNPPQIVTLVPENYSAQNGNHDWEKSVEDNARYSHSKHTISSPGYHTLKIWMVDPGVVLEKIVVDLGGVKPSYLGPPESYNRPVRN
ncbi:MAG TPA: glycosyl hydrolase 115 family protein [Bacteroidota bacterium]|nr:glycosyl hydrolase 115 family protein [Bacteroidota bacterium]